MAVFTKLNRSKIENFLNNYDIGELDSFEEIIEGIENSNFKIVCNKKKYILTIFEKRVNNEDLPFFINLKFYLYENNFLCPKPIKDINGNVINKIEDKNAVIISFLDGKQIVDPSIDKCNEIGRIIGNLHNLTVNFKEFRKNSLGFSEWKNLYKKCMDSDSKKFHFILNELELELNFIQNNWPKNLPSGIIHADLFKDNVFFKGNKISGIIDFYFSCHYFLIYDIAIVINDWCFDKDKKTFNKDYFKVILSSYNRERKILNDELKALNVILRAAAVRILITRLYDYIYHPSDALVIKKNPLEYAEILKWHQQNIISENDINLH